MAGSISGQTIDVVQQQFTPTFQQDEIVVELLEHTFHVSVCAGSLTGAGLYVAQGDLAARVPRQ